MTPKEKAKELVEKFKPLVTIWDCYFDTPANPDEITRDAKKCALVATEECLKLAPACDSFNPALSLYPKEEASFVYYWENVKAEIELL